MNQNKGAVRWRFLVLACSAVTILACITQGGGGGGGAGGSGGSPAPGGSCTPYSGAGICTSGQVACNATECCPDSTPYGCIASQECYATPDEATANCGDSCILCGGTAPPESDAGGGQCSPSTAAPGSTCPSGGLPCGDDKCCTTDAPYYCGATGSCYADSAMASAACGTTSCVACAAQATSTDSGSSGGGCCLAYSPEYSGYIQASIYPDGGPGCATLGWSCPQNPYYCGLTQTESTQCCCSPPSEQAPNGWCTLCASPTTCDNSGAQPRCCGCK